MMVELTPELIKELASARNGFYSWDYVAGLASWIIGVEAENERLQVKKVYFEKLANKWSKQYYKDCDQLRVENERLKMALEKIVEYQKYRFKLLPHKNELLEKVVDIALQALNEEWDE